MMTKSCWMRMSCWTKRNCWWMTNWRTTNYWYWKKNCQTCYCRHKQPTTEGRGTQETKTGSWRIPELTGFIRMLANGFLADKVKGKTLSSG
jgi:hypothetical protein